MTKMTKKTSFKGRQLEIKRLLAITKKSTASFVVVKGRRRVGKSRLIDEYSKYFEKYYKFEGLAPEKNITNEQQLEEFSSQISRQFKTANASYNNWSDALWAVGERVQRGKCLLFFDELSWMGNKDTTFLAKIKSFWDNQLSKNNDSRISKYRLQDNYLRFYVKYIEKHLDKIKRGAFNFIQSLI